MTNDDGIEGRGTGVHVGVRGEVRHVDVLGGSKQQEKNENLRTDQVRESSENDLEPHIHVDINDKNEVVMERF